MTDNKEREALLLEAAEHLSTDGHFMSWSDAKRAAALIRKFARQPAALAASQEKAEPVAWFTDDYLTDKSATTWDRSVAERWREKGWPVTPIYATPVAAQATHPDDAAVDRFAAAMKEKLAIAREKGRSGWEKMDPAELSLMLREHVEKGDPRDVANFCMFLWALGEPIGAVPVAAQASEPDGAYLLQIIQECAPAVGLTPNEASAEEVLHLLRKAAGQPSAAAVRDAAYDAAAAICHEEGNEWDSDALQSEKNYAHACRDRIRALKSAPIQPAEQPIGVEDMVRLNNRIQRNLTADQPIARRVWKIHPDSPLGKALREHSTKTYTPRTPESVNMEGRRFIYQGDGAILDDNFDFDASFSIGGDFGDPAVKDAYCKMICDVLNGVSPAEQPSASPVVLTGLRGYQALRDAINNLRIYGLYEDDEGEETDALEQLADAIARAQGEQA